MKSLKKIQSILEHLDSYRDKALFIFIKPYWPKRVTPNYVTSVRIAISIVLVILLFLLKNDTKSLILTLFVVGLITDFIDGPIARATNQVTELGAMLDSIADRLLIIPIAMYSLLQSYWLLLLTLICIEMVNGFVSLYYRSKEVYLESNIFGKIKMTIMSLGLVAILYVWPNPLPLIFLDILWISIPFSILSILSKLIELKRPKNV